MIIKFKNWEKYQGRREKGKHVERPSWFKFYNEIFMGETWEKLDPLEFKSFVYFLCFASRNGNRGFIHDSYRLHSRMSGIEENVLIHTIKKLKQLRAIELRVDHGRYVSVQAVDHECALEKRREEKIRPDVEPGSPPANLVFDFQEIYRKYPRKRGKDRGLRACEKQIKTEADYRDLQTAVARYKESVRRDGTEMKFIKHFSTFMGDWRDWIDPETGGGEIHESSPEALRIERLAQLAEGKC